MVALSHTLQKIILSSFLPFLAGREELRYNSVNPLDAIASEFLNSAMPVFIFRNLSVS